MGSSMGLSSLEFVDDDDEVSMIWRICLRYSSLIRVDEWAGKDNNGLTWADNDDGEQNGYIELSNGSGGTVVESVLITDEARK